MRLHSLPPRTRLVFNIITQIPHTTAGRASTAIDILARSADLPPRRTCITLNGFPQSLGIGVCGFVGRLARVADAPTKSVDAGAGCSRGVLDGLAVGGDEVACCVLMMGKTRRVCFQLDFAPGISFPSFLIHFFGVYNSLVQPTLKAPH